MNLKAYAKVNLILRVVGKNEKHYHLLQMLNAKITLYDEIVIEKNDRQEDTLRFQGAPLTPEKDNLILRVLAFFKNKYHIQDAFDIVIIKQIPIGAGVGGGSADVAAILKYLGDIYQIDVKEPAFLSELSMYGADIPYALFDGPAIVEGIGEKVTPIHFQFDSPFIYVYPNMIASTSEIFRHQKKMSTALSHEELTLMGENRRFQNDLECATIQTYSQLGTIIEEIRKIADVQMTGSGSSLLVFGTNIDYIYDCLKKQYPEFVIQLVNIIKE
ncbi:MAG: 4-(cytidine 5'-diphospho)-2-C-methyl-D-erythritol kinase [Prevotella sp.]|nr:4-(cytidine 5'-diphospho)-2-C-methyl-D-erythritol kinase [Staphylococcus sp.]MCM1350909.1 4-(cytidine 5'-diphospho)-2-C-methyl-D-erythritol kinase [Prevotella sp.]